MQVLTDATWLFL